MKIFSIEKTVEPPNGKSIGCAKLFGQWAIFCLRTNNDIEHLKLNLADRNNI